MILSHGDYDSTGGLRLGINLFTDNCDMHLKPSHVASILSEYPDIRTTMFMTSCFSGHWVETTEFKRKNLTPAILAETEQDPVGDAWSQSQRHVGVFSSATISEQDTSRQYGKLKTALVADMYRVCCLPVNKKYGPSPVFSDPESQEKFWKRTGYSLDCYEGNHNKLPTAVASDYLPNSRAKVEVDSPEATGGYGRATRGLLSPCSMKYLMQQCRLPNIENWTMAQTAKAYEYSTS